MRLRKLLLGSAAAVVVAGAASVPARAADVNGLVVTMASYVEQCHNGYGVNLHGTCLWFSTSTGSSGLSVKFDVAHGETIAYNAADPSLNTTNSESVQLGVSFSPYVNFSWSTANYDVNLRFPWTAPGDVEVDISRPGGWSLHLERYGLSGNSVVFKYPFGNGLTVTLGADFDGGDPDLDANVDYDNGNGMTAGFGVHSDDWTDPTFDGYVGFGFGDWKVTTYAATNGWGAGNWEPQVTTVVTGAMGPVGLSFLGGWHDISGGADAFAFAAQAKYSADPLTVIFGGLYGRGQADWDQFADDYGVFPYNLADTDEFYALWGGVTYKWSSVHSTTLKAFYSNSPDAAVTLGDPTENLRLDLAHTWNIVDGTVALTLNAWAQTDFAGSTLPWVGGFGATITVPIFP